MTKNVDGFLSCSLEWVLSPVLPVTIQLLKHRFSIKNYLVVEE